MSEEHDAMNKATQRETLVTTILIMLVSVLVVTIISTKIGTAQATRFNLVLNGGLAATLATIAYRAIRWIQTQETRDQEALDRHASLVALTRERHEEFMRVHNDSQVKVADAIDRITNTMETMRRENREEHDGFIGVRRVLDMKDDADRTHEKLEKEDHDIRLAVSNIGDRLAKLEGAFLAKERPTT